MKTISRTITRTHYLLGTMDMEKSKFEIKETLMRPIDVSDRSFKKEIKEKFPELRLINTVQEDITYSCLLSDFIELCEGTSIEEEEIKSEKETEID